MKILIIEDEHKIANSIQKGLEQEHFIADVAYDGIQGLDLAIGEEFDLIILDRLLPGMDGLDICKTLRKKNIHTPILLLTAKGQITDKVEGLNSGADDYVVKPFAFEELLARVKALLRRPQYADSEKLILGDMVLDTNTYQVSRGSQSILLSQKEFILLEYMLRHVGQIITKDQIINHVWNYDTNILPNTVEVYITHLRNKIDKPFPMKPSLIHTVRGFGYMMNDKRK